LAKTGCLNELMGKKGGLRKKYKPSAS